MGKKTSARVIVQVVGSFCASSSPRTVLQWFRFFIRSSPKRDSFGSRKTFGVKNERQSSIAQNNSHKYEQIHRSSPLLKRNRLQSSWWIGSRLELHCTINPVNRENPCDRMSLSCTVIESSCCSSGAARLLTNHSAIYIFHCFDSFHLSRSNAFASSPSTLCIRVWSAAIYFLHKFQFHPMIQLNSFSAVLLMYT